MVIGVVVGIIAGYSKGWLDSALGRLMDLILAFPLLLILLAMSPVLTQRLEQTFNMPGNVGARHLHHPGAEPLRLALPRPHRPRAGPEPA